MILLFKGPHWTCTCLTSSSKDLFGTDLYEYHISPNQAKPRYSALYNILFGVHKNGPCYKGIMLYTNEL